MTNEYEPDDRSGSLRRDRRETGSDAEHAVQCGEWDRRRRLGGMERQTRDQSRVRGRKGPVDGGRGHLGGSGRSRGQRSGLAVGGAPPQLGRAGALASERGRGLGGCLPGMAGRSRGLGGRCCELRLALGAATTGRPLAGCRGQHPGQEAGQEEDGQESRHRAPSVSQDVTPAGGRASPFGYIIGCASSKRKPAIGPPAPGRQGAPFGPDAPASSPRWRPQVRYD